MVGVVVHDRYAEMVMTTESFNHSTQINMGQVKELPEDKRWDYVPKRIADPDLYQALFGMGDGEGEDDGHGDSLSSLAEIAIMLVEEKEKEDREKREKQAQE